MLTTVGDDAYGGVTLAKTGDGGEAHLVGLWADELRQVVGDELTLPDGGLHWDLLLPPALLPSLRVEEITE